MVGGVGEGWMEQRAAAAEDNWLVRTRRRRATELVSCSRVTSYQLSSRAAVTSPSEPLISEKQSGDTM